MHTQKLMLKIIFLYEKNHTDCTLLHMSQKTTTKNKVYRHMNPVCFGLKCFEY